MPVRNSVFLGALAKTLHKAAPAHGGLDALLVKLGMGGRTLEGRYLKGAPGESLWHGDNFIEQERLRKRLRALAYGLPLYWTPGPWTPEETAPATDKNQSAPE